jgi:hypothetical protein
MDKWSLVCVIHCQLKSQNSLKKSVRHPSQINAPLVDELAAESTSKENAEKGLAHVCQGEWESVSFMCNIVLISLKHKVLSQKKMPKRDWRMLSR